MSKQPSLPDPAKAAISGIQSDTELAPFSYLVQAASTLGKKINIGGQDYDFTGLGSADTAGKISDQMASTLLALQKEQSPQVIAQRLQELKAADPQGYAMRQQLFDRIMADTQNHPNRPISTDLQKSLQDELAKGTGFSDAKQEEQVREAVRGKQAQNGIYLGAAPTSEEAKTLVNVGESLRSNRQQNALELLQSGQSPEDTAFREFQQTLSNLGAFTAGETPQAQFRQVGQSGQGPVSLTGGAPNTNTFNPNAAASGISSANQNYNIGQSYQTGQANPWLAGLSVAASGASSWASMNPNTPSGGSGQHGQR